MKNNTPFKAWNGVRHFKGFGCICDVHIPSKNKGKFDEENEKCIFIGCSSNTKGYRLYNVEAEKLIVSRDVIFNEKDS